MSKKAQDAILRTIIVGDQRLKPGDEDKLRAALKTDGADVDAEISRLRAEGVITGFQKGGKAAEGSKDGDGDSGSQKGSQTPGTATKEPAAKGGKGKAGKK